MRTCAGCGFLAVRLLDGGRLVEADDNFRKMGIPAQSFFIDQHDTFGLPVCFEREVDFYEELETIGESKVQNPGGGAVARMFREIPRDACPSFTNWQQGASPKEHREMLDRQWMLKREDERDAAMRMSELARDRMVMTREDNRDQAALDRHDREMNSLRWQHWRELLVFGGVLGVATVLASMIDAKWLVKPPWFNPLWDWVWGGFWPF